MKGLLAVLALLIVIAGRAEQALAQRITFLRDAEIETIIRAYSTPVFQAAGLVPENINIYLLKDNSINAFVAGGQKMFINSGLILRSEHPGQLIGVIAHETGHIAGAHLAGRHQQLQQATTTAIIATVLGGVAALATGRGELAAVAIAGGQNVAQRNFLSYSRTQEGAADQAAMQYLDSTGQSARGFLEFFEILKGQELLFTASKDPYIRSHPLTEERIQQVESHVARSAYSDVPQPPEFLNAHERMKAKLYGYLNPIGRTLRVYKADDNSIPSRYARAIGWFRKPDLDKAVPLIDGLIAEEPNNPFFHEMKGDGLFQTGDAAGALASFEKAVELLPTSDLLRKQLATAQLTFNDPALANDAIGHLKYAIERDRDVPGTWGQLGRAYFILGDEGNARLAQAEAELLRGEYEAATFQAGRAAQLFPRGTPEWLRADDILNAAQVRLRQQER